MRPTGRQEDQSPYGPGPTEPVPSFIQPGPSLYQAPPRPAAAADRPWPTLLGRNATSSSGQAASGLLNMRQNYTLRCVGMIVELPELSERSSSFSWVKAVIRSLNDAGTTEEDSTTTQGMLLQEMRTMEDISVSYRSVLGAPTHAEDVWSEQDAFEAAGLPFISGSDMVKVQTSASTQLAIPLSGATLAESINSMKARGRTMLAALAEGKRAASAEANRRSRHCTLRCVEMTVELPELSERSASFSWVETVLRSMIDAGISEEESTTPEGLLMQELRILDDLSIRYRGLQEGSCRSLAAKIGHADNRCGVLDDMGEQAAFETAGLPFLITSDLLAQSACTKLARPLSAATHGELLAILRTRGEMMLAAEEEGKRRRREQGPVPIEDASAVLEAHLVALEAPLEITPPAVQLILDELDQPILDELSSAEGQPTGQVDTLPTGVIDQKRPNSPLEDDASPSKRLKGLALGPEEQSAASEERPTRAASTVAVARLHTHFGPQRVPHAAATARLKTPQRATRPAAATHAAPAVASSTAAEERAQTAAASAAAPHPDV